MTDEQRTNGHVPTTWAELVRNPIALLLLIMLGGGGLLGGTSLSEIAQGVKATPEVVHQIKALRAELRKEGLCIPSAPGPTVTTEEGIIIAPPTEETAHVPSS